MKTRPARRPRAARWTLTAIALLLLSSGVIRLAGPAAAIAREVATVEEGTAVLQSLSGCRTPEDVELALTALGEREQRLNVRESEIEERMTLLTEAEAAMRETLAELEAAEAELDATLSVASTAAEDDLARLTTVYETMKPKEAAALFSQMDPQFAAGFLGRMRPDAAAAVMAGLDPQTAYTISVVLAARNADVPRE
jgi:flagellar motility protein MotE (MotC chaperone)